MERKIDFVPSPLCDSIITSSIKKDPLKVKKGFVALLDACGIKSLGMDVLDTFVDHLRVQNDWFDKISKIFFPAKEVHYHIFQDSIIITVDKQLDDDIIDLTVNFIQLISHFEIYSQFQQLFYRGAISFGEYIQSDFGCFGPAINEAEKEYEILDVLALFQRKVLLIYQKSLIKIIFF